MNHMMTPESRAERFFWRVTAYPKMTLVLFCLAVTAAAVSLPRLTRDASVEAFIDPDDPAVIYRDRVKNLFGLADPIVILIVNNGPTGVFNPKSLELVQWITEQVSSLNGVNMDRVTSLTTQNNIIGTEEGMVVEPFFDDPPLTQHQADQIRSAVMDFPSLVGNVVSADGQATVIAAELLDDSFAGDVYAQVNQLVESAPVVNEQFYVAGEGAVSAHLGTYIDADMRRLNLLCGLVITTVLFFSYRTLRGVLIPSLLVGAAVATSLGTMAAVGIPFYVITNAMPVILIAIGVADGIHILGQYYEQIAKQPAISQRELVILTMAQMWRPVTITSVTDIAGFLAIGLASSMPPMRAFGLFASLGSATALLLSLFAVPAGLVLVKPQSSSAFNPNTSGPSGATVDRFGRFAGSLGRWVLRRPVVVLVVAIFVTAAGIAGLFRLEVNEQRIRNFRQTEPIYQADRIINDILNGSNYLDVVIETPQAEGLFRPSHLRRIEAMQSFFLTLPHVKGTISIVDYLKQMNRAVNEGNPDAYRLPETEDLVAQYFLLYSTTGDPTDFDNKIDYDYRLCNVRVMMDSGLYSHEQVVVEAAQRYIAEQFNTSDMTAHLAGRVNVDYHWIRNLATGHFRSTAMALIAVWLTATLCFRSAIAGFLAILPVSMAVLLIYAVMGWTGIWLSVGTSMFAAIAIGTGVDFAIHTIDRLKTLMGQEDKSIEEAFAVMFPSTGRALLFNFSAVLLGFGLLLTSHVPPLIRFGALITVSIATSFVASLTVLPAWIQLTRPSFLTSQRAFRSSGRAVTTQIPVIVGALLVLWIVGGSTVCAEEAPLPSGDEVAQLINERDEGQTVSRSMEMLLVNRSGKQRRRLTETYWKKDAGIKRRVIFFLTPKNVKGTAFLNIDYVQPNKDDDRWLYLPAMRKVRRISAADRGDYFLGTDFTYEDIGNETKVNVDDFTRTISGHGNIDDHQCLIMDAKPNNSAVERELGYSRVLSWVDPNIWMLRKADYWDTRGQMLKTIYFRDIRLVQGIWTAHRLEALNHKTGHTTTLTFTNVDYETVVDDDLFTQRLLRRGL